MKFINGWPTEIVYSEDDGGWYCEVFDKQGKTEFVSDVHAEKRDAVNEAGAWTKTHGIDTHGNPYRYAPLSPETAL